MSYQQKIYTHWLKNNYLLNYLLSYGRSYNKIKIYNDLIIFISLNKLYNYFLHRKPKVVISNRGL